VRKASGLPVYLNLSGGSALLLGRAQENEKKPCGKAEPFRTSGGTAAIRNSGYRKKSKLPADYG